MKNRQEAMLAALDCFIECCDEISVRSDLVECASGCIPSQSHIGQFLMQPSGCLHIGLFQSIEDDNRIISEARLEF